MRVIAALVVSWATLVGLPISAQLTLEPPFEAGTVADDKAINGVDTVVGADGNILYIWDNGSSYTTHGWLLPAPTNSIGARVYRPNGTAVRSGETRVDLIGRMSMWISAGRNGDGYLVAWKSVLPNGGDPQNIILGRKLDASGVPASSELPLDLDTSSFQDVPVLTGLADGNSAMAWLRNGLVTRVFDTAGQPVAARVDVTSDYSWDGFGHDIAGLTGGDYVIVWSSWQPGISGIRLFTPEGLPRTAVLPASDRFHPFTVAADPNGGFVAAGTNRDDDYRIVYLRYYDSAGTPRTDDIVVHDMNEEYYVSDLDVKVVSSGKVVVLWREYTRRGHSNLYGRTYDASGGAIGCRVELPNTPNGRLKSAVLDDDRISAVWTGPSRVKLYLQGALATLISLSDDEAHECQIPPTPTPTSESDPTEPPTPDPSPTPAILCGDGTLQEGEECDDGDRFNGDGCDWRCLIEECGNERIEGKEACDDGNHENGDGCQSNCTHTPKHDSFMRPEKPIDITIPASQTEVTKVVPMQVRNSDDGERPGHVIQLVGSDGTCPVGTIEGRADFERGTEGDQDSILVAGGTPKTAHVIVRVTRANYPKLDHKVPVRCVLTFEAVTLIEGNVDPTPEDNRIEVELNVVSAGNGQQEESAAQTRAAIDGAPEFFVGSAKPIKVKVARGSASAIKTVALSVATGTGLASQSDRSVTVTAFDGDCPAGTVGLADFDKVTAGAQSSAELGDATRRGGKLLVTASSAGFTTDNTKTPSRCQATVVATSPQGDSGVASHTTQVVVEVIDLNDF